MDPLKLEKQIDGNQQSISASFQHLVEILGNFSAVFGNSLEAIIDGKIERVKTAGRWEDWPENRNT